MIMYSTSDKYHLYKNYLLYSIGSHVWWSIDVGEGDIPWECIGSNIHWTQHHDCHIVSVHIIGKGRYVDALANNCVQSTNSIQERLHIGWNYMKNDN